jgi:hypothetical protein
MLLSGREVNVVPLSHRGPISGTGTLHEGPAVLCRIRYRITVLRRFTRGPKGERAEQSPAITGELRDIEAACDLADLFERAVVLTLELEDGRLLDCVLRDAEGSVVAAGLGFREPQKSRRKSRIS